MYGTDETDVISQYVAFTKVYDEQRKKCGHTRIAIEETIRICKDKDILKDYLEKKEREVVDMLMTLFDEEQIMKNHDASLAREVTQEVTSMTNLEAIKNIMDKLLYTEDEAMDLLNIPVEMREYYRLMLASKDMN